MLWYILSPTTTTASQGITSASAPVGPGPGGARGGLSAARSFQVSSSESTSRAETETFETVAESEVKLAESEKYVCGSSTKTRCGPTSAVWKDSICSLSGRELLTFAAPPLSGSISSPSPWPRARSREGSYHVFHRVWGTGVSRLKAATSSLVSMSVYPASHGAYYFPDLRCTSSEEGPASDGDSPSSLAPASHPTPHAVTPCSPTLPPLRTSLYLSRLNPIPVKTLLLYKYIPCKSLPLRKALPRLPPCSSPPSPRAQPSPSSYVSMYRPLLCARSYASPVRSSLYRRLLALARMTSSTGRCSLPPRALPLHSWTASSGTRAASARCTPPGWTCATGTRG